MKAIVRSMAACSLALVVTACARVASPAAPDSGDGGAAAPADRVGVGGAPCASTASCGEGEVCTTEDGVCNPAPSCGEGKVCPTVCYGTCRPVRG